MSLKRTKAKETRSRSRARRSRARAPEGSSRRPGAGNELAKKLLSLRNLQGGQGQHGTIDVKAISDDLIEFDWGPDFVRLSPMAAQALMVAVRLWLEQPDDAPPSSPSTEVIVIIER